MPAAAAESRETSAVAQVAHSTAAVLLALGCTSTYPMVTYVRLPITRVRVRVSITHNLYEGPHRSFNVRQSHDPGTFSV